MARFFLVILILTSSISWAQEDAQGQPSVTEKADSYITESRQIINEQVSDMSDRIDALFGDKRADDEANESTARVEQSYFWRDGESGSYDIQLNMNLKLQNLKLREYAIRDAIRRQNERDSQDDYVDGHAPIRPAKKKTWEFSQDSGVRFSLPIGYYAHGRLRRTIKYLAFTHFFYQQVGWDSRDEWVSVTSLTSDLKIADKWVFRLGNALTWSMTARAFSSGHSASFISELNKQSAISFDTRFYTLLDGRAIYQDFYSTGATYRYAFKNGWTFLEFTPEVTWKRQESFAGRTGILVKVEAVFGGAKPQI